MPAETSELKVCFVSTVSHEAVGGLSAYIRNASSRLGDRYVVSHVARFGQSPSTGVDYARTVDEEPPGGDSLRLVRPPAWWLPPLRAANRLVHRPALRPLAVSTFSRAYGPPLRDAIPATVDVVHFVGTGWELLGFPAFREAARRGAAFAVTPAIHPGEWGDSPLDARLYREADVVFALSRNEVEVLAALGVERPKIQLSPLAPAAEAKGDGPRFRGRHGLGRRPLVLFVGRRMRYKGYHALCSAMTRVLEAVPESCLVAIGAPAEPPYPPLPSGSFLDLGECGEQEKADALAACDVFCLPSAGESFGIGYLEAWQYGKPVVAGTAPAVRELVTDGVSGYCVTQSESEIAQALIDLLLDDEARARMGDAGLRLQRERFTWDAVARVHADAYEAAVESKLAAR